MGLLDGRHSERYDFNEEVIIDDNVFTNCVDISATGLFVHTVKPFRVNTFVNVTIPAYGVSVRCLVKHSKPGIGIGLEFHPENVVQEEEVKTIIKNLKLSDHSAAEKLTILMIDSKRMIRSVYKNRLVLDGYSVAEVDDGMEAIKKMNSFPIHAVVTELEVKRIKLDQLITIIREAPDYKTVPIYVIDNPTGFDIESWVLEAGATKYMAKSTTSAAELSRIISNVLHKDS